MNPPPVIRGHRVHCYRIPLADRVLELLGPAQPDALLDDPETERRYHAEDEYMPYWARPWAASMMLADLLLREFRRQDGASGDARHRAIEIGCGLGLAGLAAASAGWRMTLCDYEEASLDFARESAQLNGLGNIDFVRADWRSLLAPAGPINPQDYSLLVAADVLFESRWVEPIADLTAAFVQAGATVLICDPDRRTAEGFPFALQDRGMTAARRACQCIDLDGQVVRATVFVVTGG